MTRSRELEVILLQSSAERPLRGTVRNFFIGSGVALLISGWHFLWGEFHWLNVVGYLFVGNGLSFFGWGAERLWYSTLSPMLGNPFAWYSYLTRIPFWYYAGGIGYVIGVLLSKKFGFLSVSDIPVKRLFYTGGVIECGIQIPLQMILYHSLLKRYHVTQTQPTRQA
ncbi:MAG: hypothetical protein HY707_13875 [Ignavibacteriae bacterium]|nr:hypothetical protein [Ignavibacteriota bacterium]